MGNKRKEIIKTNIQGFQSCAFYAKIHGKSSLKNNQIFLKESQLSQWAKNEKRNRQIGCFIQEGFKSCLLPRFDSRIYIFHLYTLRQFAY